MERVLQVINGMETAGVIENYAIGGGIAAIYYIEPYDTDDLDIFIPVSAVAVGKAGLISLKPIYFYLTQMGYHASKEGVLIEDWLVQFIPTFHPIQVEALQNTVHAKYGETETKIFSPEYLAAELLRSGRPKDHVRVLALLETDKLDRGLFHDIIKRHGLTGKWAAFAKRFEQEEV
jgi:hypothetical protein